MNTYRYYVYAYIRSEDSINGKAGTPYYIGKGTRRRAWQKHNNNSLPGSTDRIVILENNLSHIGAIALERRLIKWWGRKDNNTGCLNNKTDGGLFFDGYNHSEITKLKMSASHKGKEFTDKHKQNISKSAKTKKNIEELRIKWRVKQKELADKRRGKPWSQSRREAYERNRLARLSTSS